MKTVLLVDDEPDVLAVYSMMLELSGMSVLTASNGRDALQILNSRVPDVIVTDWMMPVMDGETLCGMLRAGGSALAHVPIIVASAAMKAPDGVQQLYDRFLRKPVEISELLAAIHAVDPGGQ